MTDLAKCSGADSVKICSPVFKVTYFINLDYAKNMHLYLNMAAFKNH